MKRVLDLVRRVAPTDATVLIQGESGTGKELVAQAIHRAKRRAPTPPFVPVNCGAISADLVESRAVRPRQGRVHRRDVAHREGMFMEAHGGTLFLDEIGELPRRACR